MPTAFQLNVRKGSVSFLPGINLGATTPGGQPGELTIESDDYRRWFAQMGDLGIRAVRIYTIHPPAFYTELERYNSAHPDDTLYLIHVLAGRDLYRHQGPVGRGADRSLLRRAHRCLRRRARRPASRRRPRPPVRRNVDAPQHNGDFFRSAPGSSPTER
jgi:hypothetical protein